jgi:hypothetical protein
MIGSRLLGDNDRREDSEALKVKCIGSSEVDSVCENSVTSAQHFKYSF